ncbi:SsgA family sporulation/cell division regulator [Amycolatopsis sp. H20-H5]|uniref:SsgA family sporulation/cell division regulator n=1 Tax=Amycolatopsis sp. H20-H5 TaxID=3046309 RepID=UPI002DB8742B|nr:SsgA family sporulation/cell division regulator [Amycolatopsis sp. H20-H5]MEC3975509.1 SsgA family sporulation/cell division regulator [Amycolatopsis sp. H20-H5]
MLAIFAHSTVYMVETFERLFPTQGWALVNLSYNSKDPFALSLVIGGPTSPLRWLFSRELLDEGMRSEAGRGDVRIAPTDDRRWINFELGGSSGTTLLRGQMFVVTDFLYRTHALVPAGEECRWIDLDHEVAKLT